MKFTRSGGRLTIDQAFRAHFICGIDSNFPMIDWKFLKGFKHPTHLNIDERTVLMCKSNQAYYRIRRVA